MIISEGLVSKTMKVLEALLENDNSLPLRELARKCGLPKSSLHRILVSLEKEGWVFQNPVSREYRMGIRFLIFAQKWRMHQELVIIASPHMEALSSLTGETVVLGMYESQEVRILHVVESLNPIKYHFRIGGLLPLTAGAMGKIMLAYSPDQIVKRILAKPLSVYTDHTIIESRELRAELEKIRQQGFSVSLEEVDIGGAAIGAPILDENDQLVAGIILDGLASRIQDRLDEFIPSILRTAEAISTELMPALKRDI
ncbi:MAG: IclR family transcriptional regulator [Synergistales bacterium]|nr:IclR family transcriptional regulator [Synergistales bacterium]